jgi:TrmH family RNA methyltransferase
LESCNRHAGCGSRLAVVELIFLLTPAESDRLRVVLVNARNPLNIGAAARAMSNFGFSRLRVVNPYQVAFQTARSAVNASEVLVSAEQYSTLAEAIADCSLVVGTTAVGSRELQHQVHSVDSDAASIIRQHLQSGPVALLMGSERYGLSKEDLSYCQWLLHIPMHSEKTSMNLGQAVAVCLYELVRGTVPARIVEAHVNVAAPAEELERLTATLLDALDVSGYIKPGMRPATDEKIRRMVRRLNLGAIDVEVWLGVVRQMLWKMRSK